MISLPIIPYMHRIYMVLANPNYTIYIVYWNLHHQVKPLCQIPVSNPCVKPLWQTPVSNPCVKSLCQTPVPNPCVKSLWQTPVSNPCVKPLCQTPVSNSCVKPLCQIPVSNPCVKSLCQAASYNPFLHVDLPPHRHTCYPALHIHVHRHALLHDSTSLNILFLIPLSCSSGGLLFLFQPAWVSYSLFLSLVPLEDSYSCFNQPESLIPHCSLWFLWRTLIPVSTS